MTKVSKSDLISGDSFIKPYYLLVLINLITFINNFILLHFLFFYHDIDQQ